MKGGYLAYHLRVNKAVERMIFIDLLGKIGRLFPLDDYKYVGFGGPFLEDFKLIHNHLGIRNMVSLEIDPEVFKRQEFNLPFDCIRLLREKSGDYIGNYGNFEEKLILWLDYSEAEDLRDQLCEFYGVIKKINHGNVVKITINADVKSLEGAENENKELKESGQKKRKEIIESARFEEFRKQVGSAHTASLTARCVEDNKRYAETLLKILKNISFKAVEGTKKFFPLTSFVYADGQNMLTFTGIVVPKDYDGYDEFLKKTGLSSYDFILKKDSNTPETIDVPNLSLHEKICMNRNLPFQKSNTCVQKSNTCTINFKIDPDAEKSKFKLDNYIKYYRYYPDFAKILV